MKKIVIEKPGDYDQLKILEMPTPKPKQKEILIETRACGVNFADCCVRMGVYRSAKEFVGWPITPGFEVAGVVTQVGEGVSRFAVGDNVIALTRFGGYTTHLTVSEDQVFPMPLSLSFTEAAAFPVVFLTASYALFELAHPRKSDLMLVHSAAGGVGSALVQLGKLSGCVVVGVVGSAHKVEAVKQLGASAVIDKSKEDLWKEARKLAPDGFNQVYDANGEETLWQSYSHLAPGGKLIIYGFHSMFTKGRGTPNWFKMIWQYLKTPKFNPLEMTNDNHSVLAFNLSYLFGKGDTLKEAMQTLSALIDEGKIVLPPIKTYPLEKAAEAQRDLESGQTVGKLVLVT